ncbi:alpha/beta fold hydrolase [Streptomyces sp. NPDC048484]|uniref:alpha/beta hydrolase n=1 Tax=Streptomyces sp. NPDC048484 TaxID=3155146 RepID=UPI00341F62A9
MPDTIMKVAADDGTLLAGTLTLPTGPGPHPAVLLLHGSGPLDRDGNTRRLAMNLGRPLADALAAEGIASLRYDRRGVGATPGTWQAVGFTDNRQDAASALRALAAHPAVRPDCVGVVGHSEGALHAMALAARHEVQAVVLLAGYARPGEEALCWQARSMVQGLPAPVRILRRPLAALGNRVLARIKETRTDVARIAGFAANARWMRENLVHDTRDDLASIHAPVLAVTGDKDVQIDPADLDEIHRLVPGKTETHRLPGLTHVLRQDPAHHTVRSYRRLLRDPVDPGLLTLLATWLSRQLHAVPGEGVGEGRASTH